jgi:TAG lipase/steryl ester hydrolase/phospholipase A2/LPA acyltransferase
MQNCGLYTFQEAFDRTGRIINIIVAPLNMYDPPRLLNYLTAPHVCVWSAAAASCAIPGVFDPINLIVKEPNGAYRPENEWTRTGKHIIFVPFPRFIHYFLLFFLLRLACFACHLLLCVALALFDNEEAKAAKMASYSDGSIENDLPMEQLSELFNVNHFIVSQVNPHSALLSSISFKKRTQNAIYNAFVGYMRFLAAQCRDWLKNIINFMVFRSGGPTWGAKRGISQALTQEYEGRENDVTISPWTGHISTIRALCSAIKVS